MVQVLHVHKAEIQKNFLMSWVTYSVHSVMKSEICFTVSFYTCTSFNVYCPNVSMFTSLQERCNDRIDQKYPHDKAMSFFLQSHVLIHTEK